MYKASTICNINVITHVMLDIQYFHYQHWTRLVIRVQGPLDSKSQLSQKGITENLVNSRNSSNQNFARINKTRQQHNMTFNITSPSPTPNKREKDNYKNNTCMLPFHMPLLVYLLNKPVFTFITYKAVSRQLSLSHCAPGCVTVLDYAWRNCV